MTLLPGISITYRSRLPGALAETTKFDMRGHTIGRHGQDVTEDEKMTRRISETSRQAKLGKGEFDVSR